MRRASPLSRPAARCDAREAVRLTRAGQGEKPPRPRTRPGPPRSAPEATPPRGGPLWHRRLRPAGPGHDHSPASRRRPRRRLPPPHAGQLSELGPHHRRRWQRSPGSPTAQPGPSGAFAPAAGRRSPTCSVPGPRALVMVNISLALFDISALAAKPRLPISASTNCGTGAYAGALALALKGYPGVALGSGPKRRAKAIRKRREAGPYDMHALAEAYKAPRRAPRAGHWAGTGAVVGTASGAAGRDALCVAGASPRRCPPVRL